MRQSLPGLYGATAIALPCITMRKIWARISLKQK